MVNSNVTTLTLNDSEAAVEFEKGYPYYFITNRSDTDMYVSMSPDITPKTEGVYTVFAGGSERIGAGYPISKFYILGTGEAYIRGEQIAAQPSFKRGGKGGDLADCTQHITNGLLLQFKTEDFRGGFSPNAPISLQLPITFEFCGYYNDIPNAQGLGRWIDSTDNMLILAQSYSVLNICYKKFWLDDYETTTIEPHENVTISVICGTDFLSLYKNGVFVRKYVGFGDVTNISIPSITFLRSNYIYSYARNIDGNIKSVRIYDRKLSDSEILQNAAADNEIYFKEV